MQICCNPHSASSRLGVKYLIFIKYTLEEQVGGLTAFLTETQKHL